MSDTTQNIQARRINAAGLKHLAQVLAGIRSGILETSKLATFVDDVEYTEEVSEPITFDPTKTFQNQQEMIDYFLSVLEPADLMKFRKDAGFWTWLTILYREQFLSKKKDKLGANACWIFEPYNYLLFRRHYIGGAVYLALDFKNCSHQAKEILFSGHTTAFGAFRDVITHNPEVARLPAVMEVAAWLYYDPKTQKKFKASSTPQEQPGTIRDLIHVIRHFAKTQDIYGVEDAPVLWKLLPPQFDRFKGAAVH